MASKAEKKAQARQAVNDVVKRQPPRIRVFDPDSNSWDDTEEGPWTPKIRVLPSEENPRLNQIAPNIFSPRFPNQHPRIMRWEDTEEPASQVALQQTSRSYRDPTIKEVQRKLGVKVDGIWGPITASAWNGYVKNLDDVEWQRQGVDPNGSHSPSKETMQSVLLGAGQSKPDEYEPTNKPEPKPAQVVDAENPDETPRQRELRAQLRAILAKRQ